MKDKVKRFIENIGGNFVEISYKDAIYQCMDLAYAWIFVLDIPKATVQNQYAYQVWTKPKSITREYFDLLENTPDFVPAAGDLVVFKGGEAGHIGIIADNNNDVNAFNIFEQNLPVGGNPRIRRASYANVLGFLRPKVQSLPQPEPIIEDSTIIPQIIDDNGNAMEVQAIRGRLNDMKHDMEALEANLQARIKEAVEKARAEERRNCNERLEELKAENKNTLEEVKKIHNDQITQMKVDYEKLLLKKAKDVSLFSLLLARIKGLFNKTGK